MATGNRKIDFTSVSSILAFAVESGKLPKPNKGRPTKALQEATSIAQSQPEVYLWANQPTESDDEAGYDARLDRLERMIEGVASKVLGGQQSKPNRQTTGFNPSKPNKPKRDTYRRTMPKPADQPVMFMEASQVEDGPLCLKIADYRNRSFHFGPAKAQWLLDNLDEFVDALQQVVDIANDNG